mmetsp:Transcript_32791/g.68786  ORF Transcript_32791/g.68786 Transcript_32791/m.68786 type:complete len:211 (-) Transcript_32791:185-817(-)
MDGIDRRPRIVHEGGYEIGHVPGGIIAGTARPGGSGGGIRPEDGIVPRFGATLIGQRQECQRGLPLLGRRGAPGSGAAKDVLVAPLDALPESQSHFVIVLHSGFEVADLDIVEVSRRDKESGIGRRGGGFAHIRGHIRRGIALDLCRTDHGRYHGRFSHLFQLNTVTHIIALLGILDQGFTRMSRGELNYYLVGFAREANVYARGNNVRG